MEPIQSSRAASPVAYLGRFLVIACLALAAGGCATSQHASGDTTFTRGLGGTTVEVRLDEYRIHMPTEIPAGHTTFKISNTGEHDHSFKVTGPEDAAKDARIDAELPSNLKPGEKGELALDLVAGKCDVSCPVGPHKMLGMRLDLIVTK
jgi:uncharacterized cupredoxin-like copper-binding protein